MTAIHSPSLKINCHDPRGHQAFLQLSKDMHSWQLYINDSNWWSEREKKCLELFQQYGYDLQSGVWYCLITCQRSGWRGIASSSLLLANGFAKQQTPCWPPLGAYDSRRKIVDWYCIQVLPQLYELPTAGVGVQVQQQMLTAVELLQQHAAALQSPHSTSLLQLSISLATNIKNFAKPLVGHTSYSPQSASLKFNSVTTASNTKPTWIIKWFCGGVGAAIGIMGMVIALNLQNPDVIIASNQIWPDNIFFEKLQRRLEQEAATLPENKVHEELSAQLKAIELRLLDAEHKRKPYITISELKTSIYQMNNTLLRQDISIESKLNRIQNKINEKKPIAVFELHSLSSQIDALKSRSLLLETKADIVWQK